MAISVQFPDGSVRDIPGQLRRIADGADGAERFEQVPVNADPRWTFYRRGRHWFARARAGNLSTLRPQVEEWWRSVAVMAEDGHTRRPTLHLRLPRASAA